MIKITFVFCLAYLVWCILLCSLVLNHLIKLSDWMLILNGFSIYLYIDLSWDSYKAIKGWD